MLRVLLALHEPMRAATRRTVDGLLDARHRPGAAAQGAPAAGGPDRTRHRPTAARCGQRRVHRAAVVVAGAALASSTSSRCPPLSAPFYVLEGSTLGGRVLLRRSASGSGTSRRASSPDTATTPAAAGSRPAAALVDGVPTAPTRRPRPTGSSAARRDLRAPGPPARPRGWPARERPPRSRSVSPEARPIAFATVLSDAGRHRRRHRRHRVRPGTHPHPGQHPAARRAAAARRGGPHVRRVSANVDAFVGGDVVRRCSGRRSAGRSGPTAAAVRSGRVAVAEGRIGPLVGSVAHRTPTGPATGCATSRCTAAPAAAGPRDRGEPAGRDRRRRRPRALLRLQVDARPASAAAADASSRSRELTGFERVMLYRFNADGDGEVLAEQVTVGAESYLGLHYPGSDIPRQARELYRRQWLRLIVSSDYRPSPLLPLSGPGAAPARSQPRGAAQRLPGPPAVPAQHGRRVVDVDVAGGRGPAVGAHPLPRPRPAPGAQRAADRVRADRPVRLAADRRAVG